MCEIHNLLAFARYESAKWKESTGEKAAVLRFHAVEVQQFLRRSGFKHRCFQERTKSLGECSTQEPLRRVKSQFSWSYLLLQLKRCRGNGFAFLLILDVQLRLMLSLLEKRHLRSPTLEEEPSNQKRIKNVHQWVQCNTSWC